MKRMQGESQPSRLQVSLGRHISRSISDDGWETVEPTHIEFWSAANSKLATRAFELKQARVTMEVDWSPAILRLQRSHSILMELEKVKGTPAATDVIHQFSMDSVIVEFSVFTKKLGDEGESIPNPSSLVEYFLNDFFLIMNLSAPSSCNFHNCKILPGDFYFETDLNLSNAGFDIAFLQSMEGKWPKIKNLPLETVIQWFKSVRSELKLLPKSNIERALFSLLHISKSDVSPMSIIWIFHALESLFDTKIGENYRSLINRIHLLLNPTASESKFLKRKMRDLYDMRSAIVHGGFNVIHPMHDERIDKDVDESFMKLINAYDFGIQIVIASLQEIISRGWRELEFREILSNKENT